MASLTWTKEDGTWGVTGIEFNLAKLNPLLYGALAKLKDYEEICDSPDKLKEIDELYREKCEEVNALKAERVKAIEEFAKRAIEQLDDMGCEAWERDIKQIAQQIKAGDKWVVCFEKMPEEPNIGIEEFKLDTIKGKLNEGFFKKYNTIVNGSDSTKVLYYIGKGLWIDKNTGEIWSVYAWQNL